MVAGVDVLCKAGNLQVFKAGRISKCSHLLALHVLANIEVKSKTDKFRKTVGIA